MLGSPRSWLGRSLLLVAALWLMGLGGGTEGGSGTTIPLPQENFTVTVADRSGQSLEAKRFTWEGKVEFRGQIGNATVSLPFNKIRSLRVVAAEGDGASQVVTGIGFLGAGIIFRQGFTVRGLTTAASLWLVAAVGIAAGALGLATVLVR